MNPALAPEQDGKPPRFVVAQSWWIAGELARRHPTLIVQWSDPTGIYDCLIITDTGDHEGRTVLWLNRLGRLQVHRGEEMIVVATWRDVMVSADPHQYVKACEAAMRLPSPQHTPPATPRTLAYRVMSNVLHLRVNTRARWDWSHEVMSGQRNGRIAMFDEALADLGEVMLEGWEPGALPQTHFWALLSGDQPRAMISDFGRFYCGQTSMDLMTEYVKRGRDLESLTASVLGVIKANG